MTTPGVQITVELGQEWTQTWTIPAAPEEADDATVELVNTAGCILDGFHADWDSEWLGQPSPTVATFRLFVPYGATVRPNTTGWGRVVIVPPDYDDADDYDPLLHLVGRFAVGDAVPTRDGLTYMVQLADATAELGEFKLGGDEWPLHYQHVRMDLLRRLLELHGWLWDAAQMPHPRDVDTTLDYYTFDLDRHIVAGATTPGLLGAPRYPKITADPALAGDVLDGHLAGLVKWLPHDLVGRFLQDYRTAGVFDWNDYLLFPPATGPVRTYLRPIVVPYVSEEGRSEYRTQWVTPARHGDVLLALVLAADGTITVRDGFPNSSRNGAWLPGAAIERDSITWRVDKDRHPNAVRMSGWWASYSSGKANTLLSHEDIVYSRPGQIELTGRVEKQLDLPFLQDTEKPTPALNAGDYLAHAHLGFGYDSTPRYTPESLTIIPEQIEDGRAWPRLFPEPTADTWTNWMASAAGRFLFVHGVNPEWHPYGRDRFHGQLTGAELTVEGGRVRMVARMVQKRPGPHLGTTGQAVTWEELPDTLTGLDLDATWTGVDALMTSYEGTP